MIYRSASNMNDDLTILPVTCNATTFLDSILIGLYREQLTDGSLGINNAVYTFWTHACLRCRRVGLFYNY